MSEFTEAIRNGTAREKLVALRDLLALKLEQSRYDKDMAPLAAQLRQVIHDIEALPLEAGESHLDELAAQRALRRANAQSA